MNKYFQKIKSFAVAHKVWSTIIVLVVLVIIIWWYRSATNTSGITTYTVSPVQKGTLIVSVSGTGQVNSSDQVDLKAKSSGDIVYVGVKVSQVVKAGTLIAEVDPTTAKQNLAQEQLNLDQLNGITTSDGTLRGVQQKNADSLQLTYETGLNSVVTIFLQLPSMMAGLKDALYSSSIASIAGGSGQNIDFYTNSTSQYDSKSNQLRDLVNSSYNYAITAYNKNLLDYKAISRFSSTTDMEALINETYNTVKLISETVKDSTNLIQFYKDTLIQNNLKTISLADTHLATLNTYTGSTNNDLTTLISTKNDIQSGKETSVTNSFNIANEQLKVDQAKQTLADCYIYAPYDGTVATLNIQKNDTVSNGTIISTFISNQKINLFTPVEIAIFAKAEGKELAKLQGKVVRVEEVDTGKEKTFGIALEFLVDEVKILQGIWPKPEQNEPTPVS